MSTDTEADRESVAQEIKATPDVPDDAVGEDTRPLPRWLIPLGGVVWLALVIVIGRLFGVGPSILVLAATALLFVVGFLFRAIQSAVEPDDGDARVDIPPTIAEVQKRAALRALKELEFEKSVGNLSPDDYEVIVGRYREEAKRAMRAVDDERKTMRDRAEKLAQKAIAAELSDEERIDEPKDAIDPVASAEEPKKTATDCAKCGVSNDDDARFCKGCGATLGEPA